MISFITIIIKFDINNEYMICDQKSDKIFMLLISLGTLLNFMISIAWIYSMNWLNFDILHNYSFSWSVNVNKYILVI